MKQNFVERLIILSQSEKCRVLGSWHLPSICMTLWRLTPDASRLVTSLMNCAILQRVISLRLKYQQLLMNWKKDALFPSPIISTAFLTAPVSQSFQRNMTSIFHLLGRKKPPAHFKVASSRPDIVEFSLETQCEAAPFVYLFCDKNSNWWTWCPMPVCVSPYRLLAPEASNICCQSGKWWKCVFISYRCCNYHNLTPIYTILTIMDNVSVCSPR